MQDPLWLIACIHELTVCSVPAVLSGGCIHEYNGSGAKPFSPASLTAARQAGYHAEKTFGGDYVATDRTNCLVCGLTGPGSAGRGPIPGTGSSRRTPQPDCGWCSSGNDHSKAATSFARDAAARRRGWVATPRGKPEYLLPFCPAPCWQAGPSGQLGRRETGGLERRRGKPARGWFVPRDPVRAGSSTRRWSTEGAVGGLAVGPAASPRR